MIENIKTIRNPLTIIAIFAALSEIAGVTAIGLLSEELQKIFIWFVMIFPSLLVFLFFVTLNFNSKVLYAPSDYKDESNFISLVKKVDQVSSKMNQLFVKVKIELHYNGHKIELPLELRMIDFTRPELLGRIGMIPLKNKVGRYSLSYLNTQEFLNQMYEIREQNIDSVLVIPCTEDEALQFDLKGFSINV